MTTVRRGTFTRPCLGIIVSFATIVGSEVVGDSVLNPTTLISPSGQYELFVDPSAMNGSGPATYRLTRDGVEVWSGDRPYSLWEAEVTDSGAVVGYAYERGVTSPGHHGIGYRGLSVIILGPEGRTLLRDPASSHDAEVRKVRFSGSDSPGVVGILVDPEGDRFVVRIPLSGDKDPVIWWTYRMSTGEKIGDVVPDHPRSDQRGFQKDICAELVPGTSLTLVQWYIYAYTEDKQTDGAALGLLDRNGKEIWRLNLPGEYDGLGEGWGWYWDMVVPGIKQTELGTRSFSFRSYSLSSRLSFAVEADPEADSGWRVVETSRVKDRLRAGRDSVSRPEIELIELEQVGVLELKAPDQGERSPIGGIYDFAIDRAGNIGFVRRGGNGTTQFVRVDRTGEILSNFPLGLPREDDTGLARVAPVSNDRWIVVRQSYADGVGTRAWWLDADSGKLDLIEGFTSGNIESLVPTGDGGFITLASHHLSSGIQAGLNRYDKDGRLLWKQQTGYGQRFSFRAATWLEGGGVAGLTSVSKTIEFFDAEGKHLRSVKVADIIQGEPNFLRGLTTDLNGGLILHDDNGSPPIYRIDADDKVVAKFQPKFPDGRTIRIYGDVIAAPDGTVWISDRHSLLRLNEEGVVEEVLGPQPGDDALAEIRSMIVDPEGSIYAVNGRTAAVHVFGSDGTPLRICRPLPTDYAAGSGIGSITVDGDGSIYYRTGGLSKADRNRGYLVFSAKCERIGFEPLGIDSISERWLFKPGSFDRWVLGYEAIHLVNADSHVTETIDRRPNRDWLQEVEEGAVAPDGSLAVIASPRGMGMRGPAVLCIYDPDGGPIRTVPLIEERIYARVAFNGSTVVTVDQGAIYLYDVNGRAPRKFVLPTADGEARWWLPYMSPDGTEVWLRTSDATTLLRYKLP